MAGKHSVVSVIIYINPKLKVDQLKSEEEIDFEPNHYYRRRKILTIAGIEVHQQPVIPPSLRLVNKPLSACTPCCRKIDSLNIYSIPPEDLWTWPQLIHLFRRL